MNRLITTVSLAAVVGASTDFEHSNGERRGPDDSIRSD